MSNGFYGRFVCLNIKGRVNIVIGEDGFGSFLAWKDKPVKCLLVVTSQKKKTFHFTLSATRMRFIDYKKRHNITNLNWKYFL